VSAVATTRQPTEAWVADQQRRARATAGHAIADIAQAAPHPVRDLVACTVSIRETPDADLRRKVVLVDGSGGQRPVIDGDVATTSAVWSPDGSRLCVLAAEDDDLASAVVLEVDGATGPVRATGLGGSVELARWSGDGNRLALVVADPRAEVSDVWGSGVVGGSSADSWRPGVLPHEGGRRRLVVWDLQEPEGHGHRTPTDLNVWEVDWCGEDLVALVSEGAGEDAWYSARLMRIDPGDEVTGSYDAIHQLARPLGSPDGRSWSVLTGFASDRDLLAGDIVVARRGAEPLVVDTLQTHVTDHRWVGDDAILFIGHRGLDTVVGRADVASGECTELWVGRATTGLYQPDLGGLSPAGEPVLVLEQHHLPPRLVRITADGHDVLLDSAGPGTEHVVRTAGSTHAVTWTSTDGLAMEGLLTVPDRPGPHALVVHVHGGPVCAYQDGWIGRDPHTTILVARGYAVFRPNPRGSAGRGAAFAEAVLGDMGGMDVDDILTGVQRLVADGVADRDRIGITGQSYGGFMAAWMPCRTDLFAASVARSPCTDWRSQHLTSNIAEFDRIFLDGDPFDPESQYQTRSPLTHHAQCSTPMLLTAGSLDLATPVNQAQQMYKALSDRGVEAAVAIYPEEGHGVQALPALADQCARMVAWFERFMAP
jgi:dipeptidyl aminopeptidase/acylaminoacyl peptidase